MNLSRRPAGVRAGERPLVHPADAAVFDELREVRNPGAHVAVIDRVTATQWRNQLVGIGCAGVLVELARTRVN